MHGQSETFADKIRPLLAKGEKDFLCEGIASKAIPQPQLLVKDHKDLNEDGKYPTRLVIPATIFTMTFLKIGYLGIKKVLNDNGVNYA
eukprot:2478032-Ditylum_brightwellii.AAC.1